MLVNVHAEDGALIDHLTRGAARGGARRRSTRCRRPGPTPPRGWRPRSSGSTAARPAARSTSSISRRVEALDAARRARERGAEIYVETRPAYLFLDEGCYCLPSQEARKLRGLAAAAPAGRPGGALARRSPSGEIQTYATDHTTWMLAQKTDPSLDFSGIPGGVSNVETMLGMLYSEGVRTGRLSLARFVAVTSTNPRSCSGCGPARAPSRSAPTPTSR